MPHFHCVARLFSFARSLVMSCAVAGCLLATECSSAEQPIQQPIEQLIGQLRQPAANSRAGAATKLARYGQHAARATDRLIECLEDTESDVRLAAAYALGCVQQDSVRVLSALVPLLTDDDEHVRYSAAWSIARIAKGIQDEPDAPRRHGLISALETAIRHLNTHEHQARHLVAIELAVARLRQAVLEESRPAAPQQTQAEIPAPLPVPSAGDGLELASRVYAAGDMLGRLQFVERLSDVEAYSDDMRRVVVRFERLQDDTSVLRYAIARWGMHGQALVAQQFDELSSKSALDAADASLVELLEPSSPQQWQQLLGLVGGRAHAIEVRLAALTAISSNASSGTHCVDCLLNVLADASDEQEVRTAAAGTLADLGPVAADAESRLVTILGSEKDPWLRHSVAHALARTASASPRAAHAMHMALLETPTESDYYCDMIDSCGAFGSLSAGCLPQLVAGLNHDDELVRLSCANCIRQIGPSAAPASKALVARILHADEHISVKNAAAAAIDTIGQEGLKQLAAGLTHGESAVREHALRALALAGPAAKFACSECLAILNDHEAPPAVRSAAATALGAMGNASAQAVPKLLELSAGDQPDMLRAASLMAAVQIDPHAARPHIDRCSRDKGMLLRASAACAYRLCGEAKTGFAMLVNMLDGSATDEAIERALAEFGPTAQPWLLEVVRDTNASPYQRLACFRLASAVPLPAWSELLPLIDDDELGDELAMSIAGQVSEDTRAVSILLAHLRDHDLTPSAHARMVRLLTPDGLGAAGDEEDWQGGLALNQPWAVDTLAAADQRADAPESAGPGFESSPRLESPMKPEASQRAEASGPSASPSPSDPIGGSQPGGARNAIGKPIKPAAAARATGADTRRLASAEVPELVEVFYGTNRSRLSVESPQQELAVGLLATAGGGLLAMLVCLIGFLRNGHRSFAIVALVAIGAVAPFGFHAAQSYSRSTLRPEIVYGGDYRAEIELGICEVSIPPGHEPGVLESPNLLKLELKPDAQQHVVLTSVEKLSKERFYEQLHSRMADDGKNILVFIHGYNVSFEDAARRTAQMAADLKFPGAPVFYSWPSQANWYGYATDKENIELSVTQIKSFLLELAAQSGATTINLVAHSMGNVGLTQALKEMEAISPQPLFNQVVLAAPDIDADVFKNRVAPYIVTKAQHVTLYTSQTDLALIASRYFNSGPRVGDSAAGVLLFPGIDTIDATAVDSSLLGHSYYGSNVSVLTDLGHVLQNQPIASREYLRAMIDAAQPYWAFDPMRISQTPTAGAQR